MQTNPMSGSSLPPGCAYEECDDIVNDEEIEENQTDPDEAGRESDQEEHVELDRNVESRVRPVFHRSLVLVATALTFGMTNGLPIAMSVLFLDWQESFGTTRARTAAVHSICLGVLLTPAFIPGYLMNRFGPRVTMLTGVTLATAGLILSLFTTTIEQLMLTTGLCFGFGCCMILLPCLPCVTMIFVGHESTAISICSVTAGLANMGFSYLYRFLVIKFSWRGAYLIISGFALNMFVTCLIITSYIKSGPRQRQILEDETPDQDASEIMLDDTAEDNDSLILTQFNNHPQINGNGEANHVLRRSPATSSNQLENSPPVASPQTIMCHTCNDVIDDCDCRRRKQCTNVLSQYASRLRSSKWKFLMDTCYIALLAHVSLLIPTMFAMVTLFLDLAKTLGFQDPDSGLFFILAFFLSSLLSRLLVGFVNLNVWCTSWRIYCACAFACSVSLLAMSQMTSLGGLLTTLSLQGFGLGGLLSIYPKCILDLDSVNGASYSLAFGIAVSGEGLLQFVGPVIVGYLVDVTQTYRVPLTIIGTVDLGITLLLVVFLALKHRGMLSRTRAGSQQARTQRDTLS